MEYGQKGWFFSLGKQSNWGDVTTFYDQIISSKVSEDDTSMSIEAEVWGTIDHSKGFPEKGDGIAFYHSSTAFYSGTDYWNKKRRIQLFGIIEDIEFEKKKLKSLRFLIDKKEALLLRVMPFIRNEETEYLFNKVIQQHKIHAFYRGEKGIWAKFIQYYQDLHNEELVNQTIQRIKEASTKNISFIDRIKFAEDFAILGEIAEASKMYESCLRLNNSDFLKNESLGWDSFIDKYFKSINRFINKDYTIDIVSKLVKKFTEGYYDIDFLESFLAERENIQLINNSEDLTTVIDYFISNYQRSGHSSDLLSILENIIYSNICNNDKYISIIVGWIISSTKENPGIFIRIFMKLNDILRTKEEKCLVYNMLKLSTKDADLIIMTEILFNDLPDNDLLSSINKIYNSASTCERIEIILHLYGWYEDRFTEFCRDKFNEMDIDSIKDEIKLKDLRSLIVMCSELSMKENLSIIVNIVADRINSENTPIDIFDNFKNYLAYSECNTVFFERTIFENERIQEAIRNSITRINNDSIIGRVLEELLESIESDTLNIENIELDNYQDTVRMEKIYKGIINATGTKLTILGSDLKKTVLGEAHNKLKELEKMSYDQFNKMKKMR